MADKSRRKRLGFLKNFGGQCRNYIIHKNFFEFAKTSLSNIFKSVWFGHLPYHFQSLSLLFSSFAVPDLVQKSGTANEAVEKESRTLCYPQNEKIMVPILRSKFRKESGSNFYFFGREKDKMKEKSFFEAAKTDPNFGFKFGKKTKRALPFPPSLICEANEGSEISCFPLLDFGKRESLCEFGIWSSNFGEGVAKQIWDQYYASELSVFEI